LYNFFVSRGFGYPVGFRVWATVIPTACIDRQKKGKMGFMVEML
jgi:hypothetical protein